MIGLPKHVLLTCCLVLLIIQAATGQKGVTITGIGDIPLRTELGAMILDSQYILHLPAHLGKEYEGKIGIYRSGSEWWKVSVADEPERDNVLLHGRVNRLKLAKGARRYYFKIFDKNGRDVTDQSIRIPNQPTMGKKIEIDKQRLVLDTVLNVGDYLLVNFYDNATDTLVSAHYYERVLWPLQLKGYRVHDAGDVIIASDTVGAVPYPADNANAIRLSPDQSVRLFFTKPDYFFPKSSLPLDYTLFNTQTGELITGKGEEEIILQRLKSGASYVLTVGYSFQSEPEYKEKYFISVAPHWYQTTVFYLIFGLTIAFGLIGAFTGVIVRRNRKIRLKQHETRQQFSSLQAQLNPHFIFNALSSIQGLVNTGEMERANRYLGNFSTLLRKVLEAAEDISSSLTVELDILEKYLLLESLRFGFLWKVELKKGIDASAVDIPTLLLQPLVENAVKHGVSGMGSVGKVRIAVDKIENDMVIEITDNGRGIPDDYSVGYGIRLTRDRIKLFNELEKGGKINLTFDNRRGTVARLVFVNWLAS